MRKILFSLLVLSSIGGANQVLAQENTSQTQSKATLVEPRRELMAHNGQAAAQNTQKNARAKQLKGNSNCATCPQQNAIINDKKTVPTPNTLNKND